VIDLSDKERIGLAKEELKKLLGEVDKNVPFLILANKSDIAKVKFHKLTDFLELG
jgi:hypothetical protein